MHFVSVSTTVSCMFLFSRTSVQSELENSGDQGRYSYKIIMWENVLGNEVIFSGPFSLWLLAVLLTTFSTD